MIDPQFICRDCHNREKFKHFGHGYEIRKYDPQTGEFLETIEADVETDKMFCYECNSERVEFVE